MKSRAYNFGAGPAMLPESILRDAQADLLNWQGQGMSVMEIGHRTDAYMALMQQAEADLRALINIPKHYHVLFLGGAARTQFAMIPMNLLAASQQGAYLVSGIWSKLAFAEACKVKQAYCVASSEAGGFVATPGLADITLREHTGYLYYTPNETVNGVQFAQTPRFGSVPLIADMTSCLLSEPIDVNEFGLIFAGAQKNISPAGLTIIIIRADLLDQQAEQGLPTMLDYRTHVEHQSLYATPPAFNCYLAAKMFGWIKEQGGVERFYQINCIKAAKLYDYIDQSSFYHCAVQTGSRSIMNVCFSLVKDALQPQFLTAASEAGLYALQGHRLVGGLRASLYNAMPMEGVDSLITCMHAFAKEHQS